jgi:hypothetical protein
LNGTRTAVLVSFRDADEPRALASRLVATATRHPRGWSLDIPDVGATDHLTFDAAALTVARRTGITRLLIVWAGADLA